MLSYYIFKKKNFYSFHVKDVNKLVLYYQNHGVFFEKLHLPKKSFTKLIKLKDSLKKQIPWNRGYFNISTPEMVAETIGCTLTRFLLWRVQFCFMCFCFFLINFGFAMASYHVSKHSKARILKQNRINELTFAER